MGALEGLLVLILLSWNHFKSKHSVMKENLYPFPYYKKVASLSHTSFERTIQQILWTWDALGCFRTCLDFDFYKFESKSSSHFGDVSQPIRDRPKSGWKWSFGFPWVPFKWNSVQIWQNFLLVYHQFLKRLDWCLFPNMFINFAVSFVQMQCGSWIYSSNT